MPSNSLDILGLGAVAIDELLYVDEYPPEEGKVRVRQRIRQCGGLTGTALVAAARLGCSVAYGGMIGDDPLSKEVLLGFEHEGVDTRHSTRNPAARPAHSTIIVNRKRHTRTIFAATAGLLGPAPGEPSAEVIQSATVLLVDHHGVPGTKRAVGIARSHGVAVVADFERHGGEGFSELLSEIDHLVVSHRFATERTGLANPAESAAKLWSETRAAVVVTCGGEGGWYFEKSAMEKPVRYIGFSVPVQDTTGCGDVFHGAYAAGLAAGMPISDRISLAAATAALKATQRGGQAGIPRMDQVRAFLKTQAGGC